MRISCLCVVLLAGAGTALWGQSTSGAPAITSVSNGASGAATIESGSWVSIYGTGLATTSRSWTAADIVGATLPTTLDNVTVLIDGKPAAIAYISPTQLNVQAPSGTATGSVPVQVKNTLGTATGTVTLQTYAPAIFTFQGKYAAARHGADGVIVAPSGYFGSAASSRPAVPGESLQIYATSLGPTSPAVPAGQLVPAAAPLASANQLQVTIGGQAATVQYAGLVSPGVYQINAVVPPAGDGDQAIVLSIAGSSSQTGVSVPVQNAVTGAIAVTVTPATATVRCGASVTLTAKVANTTNQSVTWQVNGVSGGNITFGTVTSAGVYLAPRILPAAAAVIVSAISQQDPTATANMTVNVQNALPVVTAVTPNPLNPGNATVTVTGAGFATGAVIYFAGTALTTTFVSDTQLTAAAKLTMPVGRLAAVKVTNPNPGGATSTPIAVPVRSAVENMTYTDAVRFLDMTTFGGTPTDVANLQTLGRDAWLAAQFQQAASTWPMPNSATENVTRLQTAFFDIAMNASDQLRQRVAFALAQIVVISAGKDTLFEQMAQYQRLLGDSAFGSYRDLMSAMTLSPSMGYFLDMVNNDKANPATGSVANENYAREIMQLFTIGLVELNTDGTPRLASNSSVPEYAQTDVAQMAKVMTGWSYGETPNFGSVWNNQAYYFAPMTAFEDHHDTTAKTINLPAPCTIPAGGTAESDLAAALDCLFGQVNVAPFVSYELIQRLVMSNPSAAYVGRVASVFQSSKGNLQSVVTAILTDPEATVEGTGKLVEPVLYTTGLLRALNSADTASDALPALANSMGQNILTPPSVFSYFSPFYAIPGLTPTVVAPEFQAMNASTALARANYAYRAVTNAISASIKVDLTNLTDLANNPSDLVEAINQALFRGEMDAGVKSVLMTAANASTNTATRLRSVLYAAAASPQYQVKR